MAIFKAYGTLHSVSSYKPAVISSTSVRGLVSKFEGKCGIPILPALPEPPQVRRGCVSLLVEKEDGLGTNLSPFVHLVASIVELIAKSLTAWMLRLR
jgi:hypothetical protein